MNRFDPAIDVITPLGKAMAIGMDVDTSGNALWLVFIKSTGEPWFFRNPYIRLMPDISEGRGTVSPFIDMPAGIDGHIKRYRDAGWLPNG